MRERKPWVCFRFKFDLLVRCFFIPTIIEAVDFENQGETA
jgi:hypothetical protein